MKHSHSNDDEFCRDCTADQDEANEPSLWLNCEAPCYCPTCRSLPETAPLLR